MSKFNKEELVENLATHLLEQPKSGERETLVTALTALSNETLLRMANKLNVEYGFDIAFGKPVTSDGQPPVPPNANAILVNEGLQPLRRTPGARNTTE